MTWEIFYAVLGAPLLMLLAGLSMVVVHQILERRERRLYDERGYPRIQSREAGR